MVCVVRPQWVRPNGYNIWFVWSDPNGTGPTPMEPMDTTQKSTDMVRMSV